MVSNSEFIEALLSINEVTSEAYYLFEKKWNLRLENTICKTFFPKNTHKNVKLTQRLTVHHCVVMYKIFNDIIVSNNSVRIEPIETLSTNSVYL